MSELVQPPHGGHLGEDDLVLYHFGELPPEAERAAAAHVRSCEACGAELERLRQVLDLVDRHSAVTAPEGFERVMWARVQQQLDEKPAPRGWRTWLAPRRLALAGGLAAVVVAAFVAGRWSTPQPTPAVPVSAAAVATIAPERVLLVALGDHLERSQMVLVELVNADPSNDLSMSGGRERVADLVASNRLIRQSVAETGEVAASDLLEDLERILIEFANGSVQSADDLAELRTRLEAKGILFRMRVVGSEVRQRGREQPPVS